VVDARLLGVCIINRYMQLVIRSFLNAVVDLGDLRSPPGNRLEALAGDRQGQHSIRITTNSGYALFGRRKARRRSRSWTTTRRARYSDQEAQAHASR
jgi:hypothetical protein